MTASRGALRRLPGHLVWALLAAAAAAAIPTALDWMENPSGIFHGPDGTHWGFVWDTWHSWFLPLTLPAVVLALGYTLVTASRKQ